MVRGLLSFVIACLLAGVAFAQSDNDMKRVKTEKLSLKKMKELIQQHNGKKSIEFSDEQFDAYELDNGQMILKHKFVSSAILYKSIEEYRVLHEQIVNMSPLPRPILSDYQPAVQELQKKGSSDFLKQFSGRLSFEIDPLNSEEKYLQALSVRINKYLKENHHEQLYFELVVFIGEHIKDKVKGEWVFKPNDPHEEVTEIFIVDQKGETFNPWLAVYKRINEGDKIYLTSLLFGIIERPSLPVQR